MKVFDSSCFPRGMQVNDNRKECESPSINGNLSLSLDWTVKSNSGWASRTFRCLSDGREGRQINKERWNIFVYFENASGALENIFEISPTTVLKWKENILYLSSDISASQSCPLRLLQRQCLFFLFSTSTDSEQKLNEFRNLPRQINYCEWLTFDFIYSQDGGVTRRGDFEAKCLFNKVNSRLVEEFIKLGSFGILNEEI